MVSRPRVPDAEYFGKTQAVQQETKTRLEDLERVDGSQLVRVWEKIKAFSAGLQDQVAAYISTLSMTRPEILALTWAAARIVGILSPGQGGTGTANAYANTFSSGSWRATWSLSDGQLGYAPSLRALKQDIADAVIDVSAWLALPVQRFRYRADVDENATDATWRLGFVAEDVEAAGQETWLYRDNEGELQGVAYEMLWAVHHEALRAHETRLTALAAENTQLRGLLEELTNRFDSLEHLLGQEGSI